MTTPDVELEIQRPVADPVQLRTVAEPEGGRS